MTDGQYQRAVAEALNGRSAFEAATADVIRELRLQIAALERLVEQKDQIIASGDRHIAALQRQVASLERVLEPTVGLVPWK